MADLTGTSLELIVGSSTTITSSQLATLPIIVAYGSAGYGSTPPNIVTVTIQVPASTQTAQTIDAGAYSHLTDAAGATGSAIIFDLGYSSSSLTNSKIDTASGGIVNGSANTSYNNAVEGYGTLELDSALAATLRSGSNGASFRGVDNTLILDGTTPPATLQLNNFAAAGNQLVLNGVAASGASLVGYTLSGGTGTLLYSNAGVTYSLTLGGMPSSSIGNFSIGSLAAVEGGNSGNNATYAGNLVISYVPCFLTGTMIDTPFGERPVEELREGDLVNVVENNRLHARVVRWAGSGWMDASEHGFADAAFPVRIRRGAFADAVPHRDLLVTPEHCVLTEHGLVPARMLVNDGSILIERDLPAYAFFHIELDRHSILLSEGLETESYLGGGSRTGFDQDAAERPAGPPAAPLAVSRALVEPLWHALLDRALAHGMAPPPRPAAEMTDDPDLRLLLDNGSEINSCRRDTGRHMFHIPGGARPVRLRSRAAVPSQVIGPFVDDRRRLGVAVDRFVLWTGLDGQVVPANGLAAPGWHGQEGAARWTDGDAGLDFPAAEGDRFLDVHVAGTLPYRAG